MTESAPIEDVHQLINFALQMAEDPRRSAAFQRDPEAFLEGTDLSDENKSLLLQGHDAVTQRATAMARENTVVVVVAVAVAVA